MRIASLHSVVLILLACTSMLPAQSGTVFFATNAPERSALGAGGTSSMPGNQSAVFERSSIVMVAPASGAPYGAVTCAGRSTWLAYFGAASNNGSYSNTLVMQLVDALHLAPGASNPPSLFDFYLSTNRSIGPAGSTQLERSEVVQLLPGGGVRKFISRAQWNQIYGTATLPSSFDIDAFSIHAPSGDVYWSTRGPVAWNGMTATENAVMRLPGTAYTTNPDNTIATVQFGAAQIVLSEAEVDAMLISAGKNGISNLEGIAMDPTGGFRMSMSGLTYPNLWLSDSDINDGAHIVSTAASGMIASVASIPMDGGPAFGLGSTTYSGGPTGGLRALAYSPLLLTDTPRVLDTSAIGRPAFTAGTFDLDVSGATPNSAVLLLAAVGEAAQSGGFSARLDLAATPLAPALSGPGSFPELYIFNPADPLVALTLAMPFVIPTDGAGNGQWTLLHGPLPPDIGVVFQYGDSASGSISTPVVIVTQ